MSEDNSSSWGGSSDNASGGSSPEPNPFEAPQMPAPMPFEGAASASPPPPGLSGYPPQGYPQHSYVPPGGAAYGYPPGMIPPPPPPPPPGMMQGFGIPRPTSGKAIGSLVCAGLGIVCCAIAPPIGVILGGLGIGETGANGSRSGRGLAITGLILNLLIIAGYVAYYSFIFVSAHHSSKQADNYTREMVHKDFALIRERMRTYYENNGKSLGPGGPQLSHGGPAIDPAKAPKVQGALKMEDLVADGELNYSSSMYQLTVTGSASASVTYRDWNFERPFVMTVYDIGTDQHSTTDP